MTSVHGRREVIRIVLALALGRSYEGSELRISSGSSHDAVNASAGSTCARLAGCAECRSSDSMRAHARDPSLRPASRLSCTGQSTRGVPPSTDAVPKERRQAGPAGREAAERGGLTTSPS